ncbi:unnamed protein product [Acanthoscelides obtectus]|uniref:Uncharacterized protein n=1 Tax=Acanthoscelides obtectus TaxID=200917 RepID=A0A9P0K2G6_ACAOB|nr:unnamed protein product [Acanthoscelides obtectus]CAK1629102.1 hypothetical protein AOBTE_LOCUS5579 [Acanthoscelides obtectus]
MSAIAAVGRWRPMFASGSWGNSSTTGCLGAKIKFYFKRSVKLFLLYGATKLATTDRMLDSVSCKVPTTYVYIYASFLPS